MNHFPCHTLDSCNRAHVITYKLAVLAKGLSEKMSNTLASSAPGDPSHNCRVLKMLCGSFYTIARDKHPYLDPGRQGGVLNNKFVEHFPI